MERKQSQRRVTQTLIRSLGLAQEKLKIEEGLEDIRKGDTYGPFFSAKEMVCFLNQQKKKI